MIPLYETEKLFFSAKKVFLDPPKKYFVEALPNTPSEIVHYNEHKRDFFFRTYKEVIVAGIHWTKTLFGETSIKDIYIY
jgi:hypothetical protein